MRSIDTVVVLVVAGGTLASLCLNLYGLSFGRALLPRNPLRRRIPATLQDLQKHRIAGVLSDLAFLLGAVLIVPSLFPEGVNAAISNVPEYRVVSTIGFLAVFAALIASVLIRRDVAYIDRGTPNEAKTPPAA